MSKLFVPIIVNGVSALFSVTAKELFGRSNSLFNGGTYSFLSNKLLSYYKKEAFSFDILDINKSPEEGSFEDFSESTMSISLGVFCSAFATLNKKTLKQKYDSITITGDFDIKNGRVIFKAVTEIREKFEVVQKFAKENSEENHVFIYVSEKEEIPEGILENNLTVYYLSPSSKFDELFSEIFEIQDNDFRRSIIESLPYETRWTFLEFESYLKIKHSLFTDAIKYSVIVGNGECGKTTMMYNLMRDYICSYSEIQPIWITINNERLSDLFLQDNSNQKQIIVNGKVYEYFYSKIQKYITEKKLLICIDNIEINKVYEIITLIKEIINTNKIQSKVIITSRFNIDGEIAGLKQYYLDDFSKRETDALVWHVSEKKELSETLLNSISTNLGKEPGLIPSILPLIENEEKALEISSGLNETSREKSPTVFRMVYNTFTLENKIVLFAAISIGIREEALSISTVKKFIDSQNENLRVIIPNYLIRIDEDIILDTFRKLLKFNIFIKEKNSYFSISVPQSFFVLSELNDLENQIRDIFVTYEYRVMHAVVKNQFSYLDKLLKQRKCKLEDLLRFEKKAIAVSSEKKILSLFLSKALEIIAEANIELIEDKDSFEFKSTAFYLNSKIPLEALITAARNCETDSEGYFSDENYLSELKKMNSEYIIYGNVYDFLMTLYSKYFSSLNTHKFKFVHKMLGRDILGIVKKWKSSLGYGFIYYDNNTDIYFNEKSCKNYADINNLKRGCIISCNLIEND